MQNLFLNDCINVIPLLDSLDSIVTDPPYGIKLLNRKWDYNLPDPEIWKQCLEALKPGAFLLSFASPRTYHRLAVNIEDAGFHIVDQIMWLHSQGMPKGKNLKPAHEPIVIARKPYKGSLKNNVETYGVGYFQIDETRLPCGRYPTNFVHDGSDSVQQEFDLYGEKGNGWSRNYGEEDYIGKQYKGGYFGGGGYTGGSTYCDNGSASRFYYCAKAAGQERKHNNHPTAKPIELMEYLVKLVTPINGICLDPFMGSGTTGVACLNTGRQFIGIEKDPDYFQLTTTRINVT